MASLSLPSFREDGTPMTGPNPQGHFLDLEEGYTGSPYARPGSGSMGYSSDFIDYAKSKGFRHLPGPSDIMDHPGTFEPIPPVSDGSVMDERASIGPQLLDPTGEIGTGADTATPVPEDATTNLVTQVTGEAGLSTGTPPSLPPGTTVPFQPQQVRPADLFAPTDTVGAMTGPVTRASITGLELPTPPRTAAATYQSFVSEDTPEFAAAQGQVSAQSLIGDIEGAVSEESIAQGVTEELDEKATVKFQIGELFKSFEEGKPPPPWAAPAVRQVGGMMAQRGLGASSMAAAAITQSIMESGIPIAAQDANKYATIQIQNLNNRQQAALQNAATYAAMDKANLSARMQAAVSNARSFLQMDTQNLNNEQQLKTIDLQSKFQKLFTDQAQENAARQFNAKSQLQVDQFFTELDTQVQNANASRMAAMEQFNADQTNAATRYFAKINDARERFNISNENVIQQANAVWRRNINTANTAGQNETNKLNALNLLGINQASMDKLWQRYRDEAQWMVEISENAAQRAHNAAILAQTQDFNAEQYEVERESQFFSALGSTVVNGVFGILGA